MLSCNSSNALCPAITVGQHFSFSRHNIWLFLAAAAKSKTKRKRMSASKTITKASTAPSNGGERWERSRPNMPNRAYLRPAILNPLCERSVSSAPMMVRHFWGFSTKCPALSSCQQECTWTPGSFCSKAFTLQLSWTGTGGPQGFALYRQQAEAMLIVLQGLADHELSY